MKTVHFVYTVPPSCNPILYRIDKYAKKTHLFAPSYRSGIKNLISWPSPIYAPHSITYHLLNALKKKANVKLYDLKEQGNRIKLNRDDILLVHPNIDNAIWLKEKQWKIDKESLVWKALEKCPKNPFFVIVPYNHKAHEDAWLNSIFDKVLSNLIVICGQFWTDTWDNSPYNGHVQKMLQVDMGINADDYPLVKNNFNFKHKRKFLYIGNTMPWKNTVQLEKIAENYPGFEGGYISTGEIKGWEKIAHSVHLTPSFMAKLAQEYDFFLSTSTADAQATTILEQMCFGLGVACTPESGYDYSTIIKLDKHDTAFNCAQIQRMQLMEEEEIKKLTANNRIIAEEQHNWVEFCRKIITFINV